MKLDLPRTQDFDAGVWFSTPGSTQYPTHWHDELETNLVLWGRAKYELEGREVEIGPGSLLLLAPGQAHTLIGVSEDLAMWVASFRPCSVQRLQELSGVRLMERSGWSVQRLQEAHLQELSALHARLLACDDPRQVRASSHRLLTRSLQVWRQEEGAHEPGDPFQARSHRPLHRAVARARELLCETEGVPSLSLLSRRCGLEATRLSRVFKQQMGLSIVQFRNHFRVQRFIRSFGCGERTTMLDAALDCGFGSYAQFHRAFHQVTGYAPSEHLRRVRAGIVLPIAQGSQALHSNG